MQVRGGKVDRTPAALVLEAIRIPESVHCYEMLTQQILKTFQDGFYRGNVGLDSIFQGVHLAFGCCGESRASPWAAFAGAGRGRS